MVSDIEHIERSLTTHLLPANKVSEVELVVHIINLKDEYDKKTKKTQVWLEYRWDEAEVTVVLQASDTIVRVRAHYTLKCVLTLRFRQTTLQVGR